MAKDYFPISKRDELKNPAKYHSKGEEEGKYIVQGKMKGMKFDKEANRYLSGMEKLKEENGDISDFGPYAHGVIEGMIEEGKNSRDTHKKAIAGKLENALEDLETIYGNRSGVAAGIFGIATLAGLYFGIGSVTGAAIGIGTTSSGILGVLLFVGGIVGLFLNSRKIK